MEGVIVLSGGGTGGHVFPAIALADAIRKWEPGIQPRFFGTERGVGAAHIRAAGYELEALPGRAVVGRGRIAQLGAVFALLRGALRARRRLREIDARLVIGVGGYASVPAVLAAQSLRLPTALLEADAEPGRANRLLGRHARRIFVQFESARASFAEDRALRTGFPVRPIPARKDAPPESRLRLLILGGSQGARSLNRVATENLAQLERLGLVITHQTGTADLEWVSAAYRGAGLDASVAGFFDDLPERLSRSDLVLARSGASSVAEFCSAGLPQILVPYPHAAGAHQMHNARELERAGAAIVIPDAALDKRLVSELSALCRDPERRARMGEAAHSRATPEAAARIWDACRELLEEAA
jgi:UDP-N-acetylglucosamine--N-acetylmuramyl-(pentapeptide) pyrophosphoryl-undecaprenol N-acetylglucosamine transferase